MQGVKDIGPCLKAYTLLQVQVRQLNTSELTVPDGGQERKCCFSEAHYNKFVRTFCVHFQEDYNEQTLPE